MNFSIIDRPTSAGYLCGDFDITSFPTPIGPKSNVEVVDALPTNTLLSSMDVGTTCFLRETFKAGDYSRSAKLPCFSSDNVAHISNLSQLLEVQSSDILSMTFNRTETLVTPLSLSDGSSDSPSSPSSSKKCHWTEKFEELTSFKLRFGHCLVPNNWKENVKLSQWVKRQRHQYKLRSEGKSSSLSPERIEALETLGFVWSVQEDTWGERFQELMAYKELYGHTNVPKNCKLHPQLSVWVKYQRRHLRLFLAGQRSSMTNERFLKLTELGFQWNPRKPRGSAASLPC
eukprot:Nitzschia sp. Nitz4//scaffold59_size112058//88809//89669//NITZ4_004124-RA/size112058-processed-gene-0.201-mRNA-1//1//CDS//3329555168//7202//frame0